MIIDALWNTAYVYNIHHLLILYFSGHAVDSDNVAQKGVGLILQAHSREINYCYIELEKPIANNIHTSLSVICRAQ